MIVDVFGDVGLDVTAEDVKAALDEDDGGPILVRINSAGGSVFDGVAIYSMLSQRRERVSVEVYGLAASIASVIALAGRETVMYPLSMMMIHSPWMATIGDATTHRKSAEVLEEVAKVITGAYLEHANMTEEELEQAMAEETWMNATEAVALGFATSVVEGRRAA